MTIVRPVDAFVHVVGRGLRGMLQAPLVQLLSIATTSICMLLLAGVCLVFLNARGIVASWGIDVPMAVYLIDDATELEGESLQRELLEMPEIAAAELVRAETALDRLRSGLGDDARWLAGIEPDVFPTTVEVHIRPDVAPGFAEALADRLEGFDTVDQVVLAGVWVGRVDALLQTLRRLAMGVGLVVSFACLVIVWSTIRLGVHARRTELEILCLVGGTPRFVRGPFLVEGVVQGAAGAVVALTALHVAWEAIEPHLAGGLSLVFASGSLRFFDPFEIALGVGFGAFVGLLGSRAAVARHVRT